MELKPTHNSFDNTHSPCPYTNIGPPYFSLTCEKVETVIDLSKQTLRHNISAFLAGSQPFETHSSNSNPARPCADSTDLKSKFLHSERTQPPKEQFE